jgi:ornithine cyclodeaminase/alanine dehydrogenase-like protein (mu-crystallin family)
MMDEFLVLSQRDLAAAMRFGDYVEAVAEGFRLLAEGRCASPVPTQIDVEHGAFHLKPASLPRGAGYVAVKVNGNFPDNRVRHGLPTIQGAVLLADAGNGRPLALLDSGEITLQRTGAATAVAARHLARPEARVATICGCGAQARLQLTALRHVLDVRRAFAWDIDPAAARDFAARMGAETGLAVEPVAALREATRASDAIVTCTPARAPFLGVDDVRAGAFVAAVGADNPAKSEIHPGLMARATVVVDVLDQAVVMGDLHHAIAAGAMRAADVHAELGAVVAGARPGRRTADEIIVFDSSGTGMQDVAAAARAYEIARERGLGLRCRLA